MACVNPYLSATHKTLLSMPGTALIQHSGLEVSHAAGFGRYIACVIVIVFSPD